MWVGFRKFLKTFAAISLVASSAYAAPEPLCPGGSSPRSDIQWCQDFEVLTNCITGQESQCLIDNAIGTYTPNNIEDFKVKTCPVTPAVGIGCAFGSGKASSSGPGSFVKNITGTPGSANYRFYVRFGDGYMQNTLNIGNHGPGLVYSRPDTTCSGYVTWDWVYSSFRAIIETDGIGCGANGPQTFSLPANLGDFRPQNNKWYLFELHTVLNTTASGTSPTNGHLGNGVVQIFIDGVKILEYLDVNMRGNTTDANFVSAFTARDYMGQGVARDQGLILYDAYALSTNGTTIGPSSVANSLGTGDPNSPYFLGAGGDGFEGKKLESDCQSNGTPTGYSVAQNQWGDAPSFSTSPNANNYACNTSACPGCNTTRSLWIHTTASGHRQGVYYVPYGVGPSSTNRLTNHGRVYLPSTNSATQVPLASIARYCGGGGGGSDHCYAAMCVLANGNWGICLKQDNVLGTPIDSGVTAILNAWNHFQLQVAPDNKVYLYMNGTYIIDGVTPGQNVASWAYDNASAGEQALVVGVTSDSPSTVYDAYFDDSDAGGASFIDCAGWGTSCPFAPTPSPVNWGICSSRFGRGHR
jgi:hypothetical protein